MNDTDDRDTPLGWLEGIIYGVLIGGLISLAIVAHHLISYAWGLR